MCIGEYYYKPHFANRTGAICKKNTEWQSWDYQSRKYSFSIRTIKRVLITIYIDIFRIISLVTLSLTNLQGLWEKDPV